MKLSAREDIAAPMAHVFEAVTDIAALERAALRRGIDVVRVDGGGGPPGVGAAWDLGFDYRGARRRARTEITGWNPGEQVLFVAEGEGVRAMGEIDLTALAKARTRLVVGLDLRPETLRARLLLQSFRLARTALLARFRDRVAEYARKIENGQ